MFKLHDGYNQIFKPHADPIRLQKLKTARTDLGRILRDRIAKQVQYWPISRTEGNPGHLALDLLLVCIIGLCKKIIIRQDLKKTKQSAP